MCDSGVILLGEIRCWSLLGVKRLTTMSDQEKSSTKNIKLIQFQRIRIKKKINEQIIICMPLQKQSIAL